MNKDHFFDFLFAPICATLCFSERLKKYYNAGKVVGSRSYDYIYTKKWVKTSYFVLKNNPKKDNTKKWVNTSDYELKNTQRNG
jgi:hypothetical protein